MGENKENKNARDKNEHIYRGICPNCKGSLIWNPYTDNIICECCNEIIIKCDYCNKKQIAIDTRLTTDGYIACDDCYTSEGLL